MILSPSARIYLDMRYDSATVLGLKWAGRVPLRHACNWEPRPPADHRRFGDQAPLWSETVVRREEYELLAFPHVLAVAELGWSPREARGWEGFRRRLGIHGERLTAMGVNFHRSPEVTWR